MMADHLRWLRLDVWLDVTVSTRHELKCRLRRQERCGKNSFSWTYGRLTVGKEKANNKGYKADNKKQTGMKA